MRKYYAMAALVALSFIALPKAHAADGNGWFINAGAGSNHFTLKDSGYSYSDNSTAAMFNVGWRADTFGFEAGYTDLGSFTQSAPYVGSVKLSAHGETLGLNVKMDVNPKVYLSARGGAFFWTANESVSSVYGSGSASDSSTGWYAGVGAGFNFAQNWSLGGMYNYYSMSKSGSSVDNSMFGVSIEYSF